MGLRPTKKNEGAYDWCRGIDKLDCAFNRVFSATIPETVTPAGTTVRILLARHGRGTNRGRTV